jgi:hypothetical protein
VRQQFGELDAVLAVFGEFELGSEEGRVRIDEGSAVPFQQIRRRECAIEFDKLRQRSNNRDDWARQP